MRIGFDIDGVFAQFIPVYAALTIQFDGRDLFQPYDKINPPCWHFPQYRGYSDETMKQVWKYITESPTVWSNLEPYPDNTQALMEHIHAIEYYHDVYFITDRPGVTAKRQSELWVRKYLNYYHPYNPTVLLCKPKGFACRALNLDVYIDDNLDNVLNVQAEHTATRVYLLNKNYNQGDAKNAIRVDSVRDMLVAEKLTGQS